MATAPIAANTIILQTKPMASVLKSSSPDAVHCEECLRQQSTQSTWCSSACEDAYMARGGDLLARVDLSSFHQLHREENRKFPLLIAHLMASLLAEVKRTRNVPQTWAPLELCYAELHEEAGPHVEAEHADLLRAFEAAGLANAATLELFLPLSRYRRLLGAAQLNAFELTLAHAEGIKVSALLPGLASCFNHSCEPNVLIACGEDYHVAFVTGPQPVASGDELSISYLDVEQSHDERRQLLLHKYGFECDCARCQRGE